MSSSPRQSIDAPAPKVEEQKTEDKNAGQETASRPSQDEGSEQKMVQAEAPSIAVQPGSPVIESAPEAQQESNGIVLTLETNIGVGCMRTSRGWCLFTTHNQFQRDFH